MPRLPGFDEGGEHVQPIPLRRVAFRVHQTFDLLERAAIIAPGLDRCDVHLRSPSSNRLGVDAVVFPVRAGEADVDDPMDIVGPYDDTILVGTRNMYRLHAFCQSGNCYKVAFFLRAIRQPCEMVFVDYMSGMTRDAAWRESTNEMGEAPGHHG